MSPLLLNGYEHYVFVDQCPDNSTGHMGFDLNEVPIRCTNFFSNVRRNILKLNLDITDVRKGDNIWIFALKHHKKTIIMRYDVNQVFPRMAKQAIADINKCTALFVRGYIPHRKVFEMTPLLVTIYSSGSECNQFAKEEAKKLAWTETLSRFRLRYFELLQHCETRSFLL